MGIEILSNQPNSGCGEVIAETNQRNMWCAHCYMPWKVSKANAMRHLEMIRKVSEWVKQNRKKCHFRHSTYCLLKTEDPSTETWMNIDEYKDPESYEKFTKIFQKSNPDYSGLFRIEEEVASLLVPNSLTREVYVEKPELRTV